jgi:hypothetical protein
MISRGKRDYQHREVQPGPNRTLKASWVSHCILPHKLCTMFLCTELLLQLCSPYILPPKVMILSLEERDVGVSATPTSRFPEIPAVLRNLRAGGRL